MIVVIYAPLLLASSVHSSLVPRLEVGNEVNIKKGKDLLYMGNRVQNQVTSYIHAAKGGQHLCIPSARLVCILKNSSGRPLVLLDYVITKSLDTRLRLSPTFVVGVGEPVDEYIPGWG